MDTLLNQLKEQDLELYQEIVADLLPSSDHRNNFIICGKLQEAIRARGWGYAIGRSSKGMTSASVYVPGGEGETVMGYDESEALLRAYISCVDGD